MVAFDHQLISWVLKLSLDRNNNGLIFNLHHSSRDHSDDY